MPNQVFLNLHAQDLIVLEELLLTVPVFVPTAILIVIPIVIAVPITSWIFGKISNWLIGNSASNLFTLEQLYQNKLLLDWEYGYLVALDQIPLDKNLSLQAFKLLIHEQEYQLLPQAAQKAALLIEDGGIGRIVNCLKSESPIWRFLKEYGRDKFRKVIKTNELTGKKQRFYQWDSLHNDIEVFDCNNNHLGSMDPQTGRIYKGPKNHKINA